MNRCTKIKIIITSVISFAYALLFIYAASAKLLDFENFRVQLGQSPLLTAFAGLIAIAVPVIEIVLALLLLNPRFRFMALIGSFTLMAMFTAYIYIILNYSSYVPCSCGGVLEKMTWDQHLVFNVGFLVLGVIAVLIFPSELVGQSFKTAKR